MANEGKSFAGSYVLGMGFTFDDTDTKGVANAIPSHARADCPGPAQRRADLPIHRRRGSQRLAHPCPPPLRHQLRRDDRRRGAAMAGFDEDRGGESQAKEDGRKSRDPTKNIGGEYGEKRGELQQAIRGMERVLVISRVGNAFVWCFLPNGMLYSQRTSSSLCPEQRPSVFCILQSSVHEVWARFFVLILKDDFRYTPTDCFETFPFPETSRRTPSLEPSARPTTTSAPPS